jgi:hypothetical protein
MGKITSWIAQKLGGSAVDIMTGVKDVVDEFHLSGEEKQAFEIAMRNMDYKFKTLRFEMEESYMKDRQSARLMGKTDPWTPRILTILFTAAYFAITAYMFSIVLQMFNQDMNDFVVSFISTIFGAFNAIMVQIISYYFGASKGGDETGAALAASFNQAAQDN